MSINDISSKQPGDPDLADCMRRAREMVHNVRPIVDGDLFLDTNRGFVYQVVDGKAWEMRVVPEEAAPDIREDFDNLARVDA